MIEMMGRPQPKFSEEEKVAISKELKKKQTPAVYKRLMVLKLKADGAKNSNDIATELQMYPSSVNKIVFRYRKEGLSAILGKKYKGNHRNLSREEEKDFLESFEKSAEAGQILEVKEIKKLYEAKVERAVSKSIIYNLLSRHGWRKVMPRSKHPKKADEQAIEAYKKNI